MKAFAVLMVFLVVQRLAELAWSRRNERWLRGQGAMEYGRGHYRYAVILHTAFLISLVVEVLALHRHPAAWWWIPFALFIIAQGLRYWCIATLGRYWNTRILVVSGSSVCRKGPYRFLRHPNYLAVAVEFIAIPLLFQAYITLVVFSCLNLLFLRVRISAEEHALRAVTDYHAAFTGK
jgi:methyltransferase